MYCQIAQRSMIYRNMIANTENHILKKSYVFNQKHSITTSNSEVIILKQHFSKFQNMDNLPITTTSFLNNGFRVVSEHIPNNSSSQLLVFGLMQALVLRHTGTMEQHIFWSI